MLKKYSSSMIQFVLFLSLTLNSAFLWAEEVPFRILFTGDLHSSFEAKPSPLKLGGMARLKTAFDSLHQKALKENLPVLQLDAGDCSEGSIYFNLGAGVASFQMLNRLNYDAIVVGNHDWLTGPYVLDKVLSRVPLKFSFLSANLNYRFLPEENKLAEKIKRYEIFYLVNGKFLKKGDQGFEPQVGVDYFKVGVIGLSTNEALYSFFFDPGRIRNPLRDARKVELQLRRIDKVDVIVVLSHLLDNDDIDIAENVKSIDVVIGGHSHNKVVPNAKAQPIVIERPDHNDAWLAKTGEFARYVGQMDLVYDSTQEKMLWNKSKYKLNQIDERYENDSEIQSFIDESKSQLIKKYKEKEGFSDNIFTDHIADTQIDLVKNSATESYLGNILVNAIYEKTKSLGVDFAFNNSEFFSHGILKGPIHSVDLYNAFPLVYDPLRDSSWNIWTMEIKGESLKKAIDLVFMMEKYFDVAGIEIIYNAENFPDKVISMKSGGVEIEDDKIYKVAGSQGIAEALKQVKEELPGLGEISDTQLELWPVFTEYVRRHSPLRADDPDIKVTGRIRTIQPDVAIFSEDIQTHLMETGDSRRLELSVLVKNLGYGNLKEDEIKKAKTDPSELYFYYDTTPENAIDDIDDPFKPLSHFFPEKYRAWSPVLEDMPSNLKLIDKLLIPSLGKDQSVKLSLTWNISQLPKTTKPITVYLSVPKVSGTGFISVPSADNEDEQTRKLVKVDESNIFNNKARAYIHLK